MTLMVPFTDLDAVAVCLNAPVGMMDAAISKNVW